MSDTPSIDRYLEGVLRAILKGEEVPPWSRVAEDWITVWSRIDYHGIAFVLHHSKDQLTDWPELLLARMEEECRLLALWEATHRLCVAKAIEALATAQIPSVIMKGTALAYLVHDEPAARRRGDSDLLIKPEALARARTILSDLGWRRQENTTGIYNQETWHHDAAEYFEHAIDLHWSPLDRPGLQRLLPIDEIFYESKALPAFNEHAFRPSLPAMVIHATVNQCMHAQYGYFAESGRVRSSQRLIWSLDFALMGACMEEAGWARLVDDCCRKGIGPLVGHALDQARLTTAAALP
ncbi:MAG: nucleotidyltransferase family protein, partial [Parvularcula sp.]|nr:nucleotidyltransferase family protein [Parvularcula sp.]